MTSVDRVERWLDDLVDALADAAVLVGRGRGLYDRDLAIPLAFEALSNRIGGLAEKLTSADPVRFSEAIWTDAARNRDFVVRQYHRLDADALWVTASRDFPAIAKLIRAADQ